jgi:hypothetical protein
VLQPTLPSCDGSLLIRTDFSSDTAWQKICEAVQQPQTEDDFSAHVECISDKACDRLEAAAIRNLLPADSQHAFVFLVDAVAITRPDHPILVLELNGDTLRTFRVIPSEAWSVENNLTLANMDFDDFLVSCDQDGVFRGYPA